VTLVEHGLPVTHARRILCRICQRDYPTTRDKAWYDAVDHLLDEHPALVKSHPHKLRSMIVVAAPAERKTAAELFKKDCQ
jgi:hypothetical protein